MQVRNQAFEKWSDLLEVTRSVNSRARIATPLKAPERHRYPGFGDFDRGNQTWGQPCQQRNQGRQWLAHNLNDKEGRWEGYVWDVCFQLCAPYGLDGADILTGADKLFL